MTDYYVSSRYGSDSATGLSQDTAWQSLSMLDHLGLSAGDRILLEAGSVFNDTLFIVDDHGLEDNPILITSYGDGDPALLVSDTDSAVIAARSSHVTIENISIGQTVNSGIYGWDSNNWVMRNLTFEGAGGEANQYSSVSWKDSTSLIFENNDVSDTYGDGMFLNQVNDVLIRNNFFCGVTGSAGDNVQVIGNNIVVENNVMLIEDGNDTTKGNMVLHGDQIYIADNYLEGGSYGVSLSGNQIAVEGNTIRNHDTYSWSMGIGINDAHAGDQIQGLVIQDNAMAGAPNGISFYGAAETYFSSDILSVTDMTIRENYFYDWYDKAVKFTNTDVSGDYVNNTYYQLYDEYWSNSYANSTYDALMQGDNVFIDPLSLLPPPKVVTITASGSLYDGAPIMQLYHNAELVYQTDVLAEKDDYSFTLNDYDISDRLDIKFVNDKYNHSTGEDRNLYLHDIKVDGQHISFWDADFSGKAYANKQRSLITFSAEGTASFTGEDAHLQQQDTPTIEIRDILDLNEYLLMQEGAGETIGTISPQQPSLAPDFGYVSDALEQILGEYV